MPVYGEELVVLRAQPFGEADRLLTLFGRDRGLIHAVARGVRRTSSKFGARLEPFNVVDVQLFTRNLQRRDGLETVTQAVTVHALGAAIAADYEAFTAASTIAEFATRLFAAEPAQQQWVLMVGALRDLARRAHPVQVVLDGYLLRALALAGWEPSFANCARCGAPGPHERLSYPAGGAVCTACALGTGAPIPVDIDAMRYLWALLAGHRGVLDAADATVRNRAGSIVNGYVEFHLERGLRARRIADAARLHGPAGDTLSS